MQRHPEHFSLASRASWSGARAVAMCALLVSTLSPSARADEAADTAAARVLGVDGVLLADDGRCAQAIDKLERAEALHHAPTTAERLGECTIEVGKLVAGTELLQRVIREPLSANAPAPFVQAIARAKKVLDKATPRIAMLRIAVKVPPGVRSAVTVDGEPVPEAVVLGDRPTDPGPHTLKATARGFSSSAVEVVLAEGETKSVSVELKADASAPPSIPFDTSTPGADAPQRGSKTAAYVALGIGLVGLGVGAVAGAEVSSKSSSLSSACGASKVCPADEASDIRTAKTWAALSTAGFIVGGAGLATGLLFFLTTRGSSRPAAHGPTVRPVVGASYVGLDGAF